MDKFKAKIPGTSAYKAKKSESGSNSAGDAAKPAETGTAVGTSANTGTTSHMQPATGAVPAQNVDTLQPSAPGPHTGKQIEEEELQPSAPGPQNAKQMEEEELQPAGGKEPMGKDRETMELQPEGTQHNTKLNELQPAS